MAVLILDPRPNVHEADLAFREEALEIFAQESIGGAVRVMEAQDSVYFG
jgi:hypothetical protein